MKKKSLFLVIVPLLLFGCQSAPPLGTPGTGDGSNYTPVIDGAKNESYYKNLRECRKLAYEVQRQQETGAAKDALIGALIGAAIGASEDKEAAAGGALAGGIIGGSAQMQEARNSGKEIVRNCMRGRGYNVLL
ncbi:MAG: glycine zipper family protein [Candidatus Thioglobus sp.]|nr:MAG: glycine zipper family protein [Candidatus Thioglobus sp.]